MGGPNKIYQGSDFSLVVSHNFYNLTSASEIELRIDTPTQIVKKMTEGGIYSVTASTFTCFISDEDTQDIESGEYRIQCLATVSGNKSFGQLSPSTIRIEDSIFTTTE